MLCVCTAARYTLSLLLHHDPIYVLYFMHDAQSVCQISHAYGVRSIRFCHQTKHYRNFCAARFLQKYFINISDIFFKALVGPPLCQDPKYVVLVALCHKFVLYCYYTGSKFQERSTWVTFSGMTIITSLMKVQNLQAREEHGPCDNSICFIIFFFHFRKEHWKRKNFLIFG
jgi:hypothetical protein